MLALVRPLSRYAARSASTLAPISWREGRYDSVEVTCVSDADPAEFVARMNEQLPAWKLSGKGAVWLELQASQGNLIAAAAAAGFTFHSAEGRTCNMMQWLQDRPCPVPPFATHHVGVGGVVLDSDRRILLVKDRNAKTKQWKFPGGLSNLGEDLGSAAVREVIEETGVQSRLRSVLAFRQMHRVAFGRSDLYVLCHLDALTTAIVIDPIEIAEACWMPLDEFIDTTKHPLAKYVARLAGLEIASAMPDAGGVFVEEDVFIPVLNANVKCFRSSRAGSIAGT